MYLIAFENISKVGEQYILEDVCCDVIELRNKQQNRDILNTLHYLPDNSYLKQQSLVCEFMYDNENNRIFAIPHTIITDKTILKLLDKEGGKIMGSAILKELQDRLHMLAIAGTNLLSVDFSLKKTA